MKKNLLHITLILTISFFLYCPISTASIPQKKPPINNSINKAVPLIISTDLAIGLIDHHGNKSPSQHAPITPQDTDDGLTVALALNLQQEGLVNILAIIPTFGNATLPAEMLATHFLVRQLKHNNKIPIVQGALGPIVALTSTPPLWYNHKPIPMTSAFLSSCSNLGVEKMHYILQQHHQPITILALGPLTDIACLLGTHPEIKPHIKEIIITASQLEQQPLKINGKPIEDFNFTMDPFAGALLLSFAKNVKLTFMTFALTAQTSNKTKDMHFDNNTLTGPIKPTMQSQRSLKWLHLALQGRNQSWEKTFGLEEGPFDQYALIKAIYPTLFNCQLAYAYLGPDTGGKKKPWGQITLSLNPHTKSQLVDSRITYYRDIPQIMQSKPPRVSACINFTNTQSFNIFKNLLYQKTW